MYCGKPKKENLSEAGNHMVTDFLSQTAKSETQVAARLSPALMCSWKLAKDNSETKTSLKQPLRVKQSYFYSLRDKLTKQTWVYLVSADIKPPLLDT